MNTPVSFEIAKLLKEKEIYIPAFHYYENEVLKEPYLENGSSTDTEFRVELSDLKEYFNKWSKKISAPTIAEVVMWLYENHGIWIYVDSHEFGKWCYYYRYSRPHKLSSKITENGQFGLDDFNSPTEAYEAAIEYTLKNLI